MTGKEADSHFHVFTSGTGRAGFTFSRFHVRDGEGRIHIFTFSRPGGEGGIHIFTFSRPGGEGGIHIFTFSRPGGGGRDSHFHVFTSRGGRAGFTFSRFHVPGGRAGFTFSRFHVRGGRAGFTFSRFHVRGGRAGFTFSRFHVRCGEGGIHIFTFSPPVVGGRDSHFHVRERGHLEVCVRVASSVWVHELFLRARSGRVGFEAHMPALSCNRVCRTSLGALCKGLACQIRFRLERKLGATMEAFAPGATVIHSVSQKVHKVGDDRRLLCRARVAEQMLRLLEVARPEDDLCQKCLREPCRSRRPCPARRRQQWSRSRRRSRTADRQPLSKAPARGAALSPTRHNHFLEEPGTSGYEVSNLSSSGVGRIPVCHPSPSGPPCKGLAVPTAA